MNTLAQAVGGKVCNFCRFWASFMDNGLVELNHCKYAGLDRKERTILSYDWIHEVRPYIFRIIKGNGCSRRREIKNKTKAGDTQTREEEALVSELFLSFFLPFFLPSFLWTDPVYTIWNRSIFGWLHWGFWREFWYSKLFCHDMQINLAAQAPLRQLFKDAQTVQCRGCEQSVDSMTWRWIWKSFLL